MKRNSLLTAGMLLSAVYSLCFVASLCVGAFSAIYFFVSDSITLVNDLLLPIINPFMSYGKTVMLVFVAVVVVYCLFMLIASTRYTKYFNATNSVYNKKRGLLVFNLVFFIITFGIFCYMLSSSILKANFAENIIYNTCLIFIILIHIIAIVFAMIGLCKYPKTYEEPETQTQVQENTETGDDDQNAISAMLNSDANQPASQTKQTKQRPTQVPSIKPIYTAGLDGETEDKIEKELREANSVEQSKQVRKPEKDMESMSTKKLIEAIGKLDEMRKNGEISMEEYTKLRTKMIQKFAK